MPVACRTFGCKADVPPELEADGLCVLHFTVTIEQGCAEMRRETVTQSTSSERREEIERHICEQGEKLARVSTSGLRLPDEMKARILSTFLTLMNLRESLDRAAARQALPSVVPSPAKA